ncbi:MAG: ATP-binding protein [Bifidobacteriaceae bacterium]|jgi:signal transduction histidine kinase|nr:ATP-binding protein [Bifidobacteriaceae bacterium]MCI1914611.1 ATP-binding protein [Bifidobacteriaceae bacterium]
MDLISIVVIATFGLIAAAVLASGIYWIVKLGQRAAAASRAHATGSALTSTDDDSEASDSDVDDDSASGSRWKRSWSRSVARVRHLRSRARQARRDLDPDFDDDDELPAEATALLSATPLDSVIVDVEGEVLRSSPEAYRLGVVANDAIVEPKLVAALDKVFGGKGKQQFDLVTHTPVEYVDTDAASARGTDIPVATVTRRNWLKVSVARLSARQAVVLMEDVSEQRRFARIRDAFVSNVTEQLLKPTQALEQLGTALESERLDQESLTRYAEQVRSYSGDLNHLVSDLLLLLKAQEPIEASDANLIDLKPVVDRVVAKHLAGANRRGIVLHSQTPAGLMVNGQVDQLEGAISKLVDNAINYSSDGTSVGIAASRGANGTVVLRVVDHGIGIPKSDQPHIFERFWRGSHQGARPQHGTGLGLAIVKHVALTHHGSVSVWSAPGEGSTFSLTLPGAQETE